MPPSCLPPFLEQGCSISSRLHPRSLATKRTLCFEHSMAVRRVQRAGPTVSQVNPCTAHSRRQPDKEPPSSHQGPELELPPLFAVLAHGHLVLVDVEQDLLHGGILPCLLLRNRVLLAVGALERLALQVRHIMQTQSRACAHQDGAGRRLFRSNNAPSPCLLHGLCLPCGILRIDCKLSGLAGK